MKMQSRWIERLRIPFKFLVFVFAACGGIVLFVVYGAAVLATLVVWPFLVIWEWMADL